MNNLAIDCETLSLEPNAHILSIGAQFFDPVTGAMGTSFYVEIDAKYAQPNADVSASTAAWWANQPTGVMPQGSVMIGDAIRQFVAFIDENVLPHHGLNVYQQGDRDALWLSHAGNQQGVAMPWVYHSVYCARTLARHFRNWAVDYVDLQGVPHNALDDARFVAHRMCEVLKP